MTTDISNFSQACSNVTFLHTSCASEMFLQERVEGRTITVSYTDCSPGPSLGTSSGVKAKHPGGSCGSSAAPGGSAMRARGQVPREQVSQLLPAVFEK